MPAPGYNRILAGEPSTVHGQIEGYIDNIKNRYGVRLNMHDVAGVSSIGPAMEKVFSPYLYHNNSFCNFIKRHAKNFSECVENKDRLCLHCQKRLKPFYGSCYMGVEELIYPVKCGEGLIAVICAGQFFENRESSLARIRENAGRFGIDEGECCERYLETARQIDFSIIEFSRDIGMLGECISLLYANCIYSGGLPKGHKPSEERAAGEYKDNFIISNTLHFIKENFTQEISLQLLAANSYCNPSYLSHIFKEKTGINIIDYIRGIRVEAARQLLDSTSKPVTEICMLTGFNDSGYFSRVFRQMTGLSPKEYRERR